MELNNVIALIVMVILIAAGAYYNYRFNQL